MVPGHRNPRGVVPEGRGDDGRGQARRACVHRIPEITLAEDLVEQPIERLKEIRRRADVMEIFPNPPALLRLATAVVIEADDEWQVTRR